MKVRPIHETHTVASSLGTIHATIDQENIGGVLHMLSNVYSHPEEAVVREYSTNALDSHVAAGNPAPIEVTLPREGDKQPMLVIRDYGLGLDKAELHRTYLSYGASTKRDSDDYNGTLGIGSKAGLTYAPLGFQVAAVKDGHKILAVVAQDSDGVGVMEILAEFDTNELNGVTISVPVESGDCWKFTNAARDLFSYWAKGTVLVDGAQPESVYDNADLIWLDEGVAIGRGIDSKIVMANVAYNCDITTTFGYGVIAYVPVGSVHFTPSREELHYTDLTNDTVATLKDYLADRERDVMTRFLTGAGNAFQRLREFHNVRDMLPYQAKRTFERAVRPGLPKDPAPLTGTGYRWRPGKRNGVATFESLHYNAIKDLNDVVIVGYPFQSKTLTSTQKARLNRFTDWVVNEGHRPYTTNVVCLPGPRDNVEMLEGRDNVWTWDEVVAATPPLPKVKGGSRPKTEYRVWVNGVEKLLTADEIAPTDGPIVWHSFSRWGLRDQSRLYPEAQHVMLRASQVDKFVRLHPTAVEFFFYKQQVAAAVKAALTEADGVRHHGQEWEWLAGDHARILDPALAEVLRIVAASQDSDTLRRARELHIAPEVPESLKGHEDRYPLLRTVSTRWERDRCLDELVLYMNARYLRDEEERQVAEEAEVLANSGIDASIDDDVDVADEV